MKNRNHSPARLRHLSLFCMTVSLAALSLTACGSSGKSASTPTSTAPPSTISSATAAAPVAGATTSADGSAAPPSSTATSNATAGGSSALPDVCALLPPSTAAALSGKPLSNAKTLTGTGAGVDACAYSDAAFDSVTVTVWEPSSGATWQGFITSEQSGGSVTNVTGVGDKAIEGQTELDVQDGDQFISVEGAGGTLTGDDSHAIAMAKALIALLH